MTFGRYLPITQLGAGRDGVRYRGEDPDSAARVEIIALGPAAADLDRWPRVAKRLRAAAMLDHPTARRVVHLALDESPPFAVLEPAPARSLADALSAGPIDRAAAICPVLALAEGLVAAHRLGLAHGRLAPGTVGIMGDLNLRVDWTGLDLAPPPGPGADPHESCRPPEASAPGFEPSAAADVFALGVILVWSLTGRHPWEADPSLADPVLDALAARMLAIDPLDRPTAREAAIGIESWRAVAATAATGLIDSGPVGETSALGFLVAPEGPHAVAGDLLIDRPELGRYHLIEKLGQGGMGAVYRAVDRADGTEVAIKVLSPAWVGKPQALRRFLKEARMLAEVNSPQVTNFIEINEDAGIHYLALEYVRGTNLSEWLARKGRADEPTALAIMADVARALAVAHERAIVHRDVKPENILIVDEPSDGSPPRVKLSDFGLARHIVESDSLVMTQAGTILGTPLYMAPEQCVGETIDARADVYAMGATLFHLLAGRPPFLGNSPLAVIAMHQNTPPPLLKDLNGGVSDAVAEIVAKTLAKTPAGRYPDATSLLIDLERLLRGEPTGVGVHPRMPDCDPKDLVSFDWRLDLEAAPWQLWPHVANTERLNKAVGVPAVDFTTEPNPDGGVRRFGEFRKAGMTMGWEEHPFEWVEGRRMGVLREYSQGPFRWFVSIVELAPKAGGGTTLHHRVRIASRGLLGRTLAAVEVGVRGRKAVEGVYRRIDASVLGKLGRDGAVDPFEPPAPLARHRQARLDRWLDSLGARGLDPTLVDRFGEFLAHAPSQEVARIRPLALARRLGVDPDGVVTACLLGANEGTLTLLWDILCPVCRIPSQVIDTLRSLKEHGSCPACRIDFDLDFSNSVELIFRVHPEVRETDVATYCVGGPSHSPHVVAQTRVGPGERVSLDLTLSDGAYRFRGPQLPFSVDFRVEPRATADRWDLPLGRPPGPELPRALRSGGQVLLLDNDLDREVVVRVERIAPRDDALTAGRASTLALFRELFPGEILGRGQLVNLATATFVVTDLDGAGRLYDDLGEARAFALIHEHFRAIDAVIRREGGALIKTVDEGIFAAFSDPLSAVQAALALPGAVRSEEASRDAAGSLRIGIHRGPAMVATLNDHLDYFGSTVRAASALPKLARGGETLATASVTAEPRVAALLEARGVDCEVVPGGPPGLAGAVVGRLVARPMSPNGNGLG